MSEPVNFRVGWVYYTLLALAVWWAWPNWIGLLGVGVFFGVWFWNAEKMQRTAEKERELDRAEEEFATFDPEILELDRQLAAIGEDYYPGVSEERQRLLNARKHRVIVMLRERGLLK